MGAKTWMLVYSDRNAAEALAGAPALDRDATLALARRLFPKDRLEPIGDGALSYTCPPDGEIYAGCFPGVSILAATEFGIDLPSTLPEPFVVAGGNGTVFLHAMHSVVDWLAFAKWMDGKLVRSLSFSPDHGILEDIGQHLPFEEPFWSGEYPASGDDEAEDDYPFPFHPLELGEAALKEFFGYTLEGPIDPMLVDADAIPLMQFRRSRSGWKFW